MFAIQTMSGVETFGAKVKHFLKHSKDQETFRNSRTKENFYDHTIANV